MDILSLQQKASSIVRDNQKPPRHIFLIHITLRYAKSNSVDIPDLTQSFRR